MDGFLLVKSLHSLATVLLFGTALALGWRRWRLNRGALEGLPARLFRWPALYVGGLVLGVLSLPVTGWWLAHLAGWPLGQLWLLGGSLLYLLGAVCWLWLLLRALGRPSVPRFRSDLALAGFGLLCFVAIAVLMVAKPV